MMERNCDIWRIHAHARCRHVVSQSERLHRAQKDREVIIFLVPDMRWTARDEPDVFRPEQELWCKCRKPINFLISMAQRTDGPRAAKTHGGVVSRRTKTEETQGNKKQGRQQVAAQEQIQATVGQLNRSG